MANTCSRLQLLELGVSISPARSNVFRCFDKTSVKMKHRLLLLSEGFDRAVPRIEEAQKMGRATCSQCWSPFSRLFGCSSEKVEQTRNVEQEANKSVNLPTNKGTKPPWAEETSQRLRLIPWQRGLAWPQCGEQAPECRNHLLIAGQSYYYIYMLYMYYY